MYRKGVLLLGSLLIVLSFNVQAALVAADWTTPTMATLDGVSITMSGLNGSPQIGPWDLSAADFAAAPLSSSQETLHYAVSSDWTATFGEEVGNLKLYIGVWRGVQGGEDPVTYAFDAPFTVLSGLGGASIVGNTISMPASQYHDGIIEFAGPLTSLSVASNAPLENASQQAMTFGSGTYHETSIPALSHWGLGMLAVLLLLIGMSRRIRLARKSA